LAPFRSGPSKLRPSKTAHRGTGHLRTTIDVGDLLKLANGIAVASAGSADVTARLFEVVLDGLQNRPPCSRHLP
jgi:hypothetical protein